MDVIKDLQNQQSQHMQIAAMVCGDLEALSVDCEQYLTEYANSLRSYEDMRVRIQNTIEVLGLFK